MKYRLFSLLLVVVALSAGLLWWGHAHPRQNTPRKPAQATSAGTTSGFNKQQYPLDQPASLWVIVNKPHGLTPLDYKPTDLVMPNVPLRAPGNDSMQVRQSTGTALETMFAAAAKENIKLMLSSGYRSYSYQTGLYNGYVSSQGQAVADQQSARPGHSEHQTGLAVDIEPVDRRCELQACFGDSPEGKWLLANAYSYGFMLRYPADKVAVTGYEYEPWHFRYVGMTLAAELHKQGVNTLEEFFGVSGGSHY